MHALASYRSDAFELVLGEYPAASRHDWHSHAQPILTLLLAGHVREQVGSWDVLAGPLDVGLKPSGMPHTDEFLRERVRVVRVAFAPGASAHLGGAPELLACWSWRQAFPALRPLLRAAAEITAERPNARVLADALDAALAALAGAPAARAEAPAPAWLLAGRARLEHGFATGVRLAQLAAEARVHPVYFARQFRRFFGCSVGAHVRRLRIRAAAALLADPRVGLAHAACRVGCADQAHLTRVFAAELGMTPARYRRLVG